MTAQERITEWAAMAENATDGPWVWEGPSRQAWPLPDGNLLGRDGVAVLAAWSRDENGINASQTDRALIAASRTAVPAMAAALTAVLEHHRHAAPEYPNECADGCQWPCPTVADIETALGVTP